MQGNDRGKRVILALVTQVKAKLLEDFHSSLQKTEEGAREIGAPFGEAHRLEIMMGFAQGCLAAGAEILKDAGVHYLHYLAMCACTGAEVRPVVSKSEESLHMIFHRLMEMFPHGDMPDEMTFESATNPLELLEVLNKISQSEPTIPTEDLN